MTFYVFMLRALQIENNCSHFDFMHQILVLICGSIVHVSLLM